MHGDAQPDDFVGLRISEGYRKLNAELHAQSSRYGAGGFRNEDVVRGLMAKYGAVDVLDYGCGKGSLRERMGRFVKNYDPAFPAISADPVPADVVVCADVMEHVELDCVDAVLDHIKLLTKKVAYFVIVSGESKKELPDGRNAHICIQKPQWWEEKLRERFTVSLIKPMPREATEYVCETRL